MRIKISSLDRLFSRYVRMRDKWTCQRCGRPHAPNKPGLDCAHVVVSRGHKSTRFDPENCVALCRGCHSYLDRNPREKDKWFIEKYGLKRFEWLVAKGRIIKRFRQDDAIAIGVWLRNEIKKMEDAGDA